MSCTELRLIDCGPCADSICHGQLCERIRAKLGAGKSLSGVVCAANAALPLVSLLLTHSALE